MRQEKKTVVPPLKYDGAEVLAAYVRSVVEQAVSEKVKELEARIESLSSDLEDFDNMDEQIHESVNEAMNEYRLKADDIEGLDDAIESVLENATISLR